MYAVIYPNTKSMIARDAQGNYHIYDTKQKAEEAATLLGEGYWVKEL